MAEHWRLRPARPADAPALARLERRCFSDPWTAQAFVAVLRSPHVLGFVVEQGEEIVGYFLGRAVAGEGEILNLAVVPEERGQGLGAWLLVQGLERLRRAGAGEVFLEVRSGNAAALALYRRQGFTQVARRHDYYRQPVEDALVLRLPPPAPA